MSDDAKKYAPTPEQAAEYERVMHAMQTGVEYYRGATDPQDKFGETSHKHLRVGVNSAMIECGAIGRILMDKGICTSEEYYDAIIAVAKQDVASYTKKLEEHYGTKVTLS